MGPLGLLDGKLVHLDDMIVQMEDRGHQFGDGAYEVTRVYNGRCFTFDLHMERLYRSLRELRIPATYTPDELKGFHDRLIAESGLRESAVYLQITRGVAPRGHAFPDKVVPRLTMSIRSAASPTAYREAGAKVILIPDERWLRCDIKSINLLGNVLGKQQAKEAGCLEAVQVRDGIVTEGTSTNFFAVKDGVLWTHPANNLILRGITRTFIMDKIVPKLGLTVLEKPFAPTFLKTVDEAFICATTTEVVPVITINDSPVGGGVPGSVCRQIQTAYDELIDRECGRR